MALILFIQTKGKTNENNYFNDGISRHVYDDGHEPCLCPLW